MKQKTVLVDNKAVPVEDTKVTFGAISSTTPQFAKWLFRGTLILTSVVAFWIAGTGLVSEANKLEVVLALKGLDILVFGFSKLFGVKIDETK